MRVTLAAALAGALRPAPLQGAPGRRAVAATIHGQAVDAVTEGADEELARVSVGGGAWGRCVGYRGAGVRRSRSGVDYTARRLMRFVRAADLASRLTATTGLSTAAGARYATSSTTTTTPTLLLRPSRR